MATTQRKRKKTPGDGVQLRGFVRLELIDVRGSNNGRRTRTKWMPNAVVADGFQNYIVGPIGAVAGSKTISHHQLATQTTAPSTSQQSASGEFEARKATTNTFVANGTLRATSSWATNEATQSVLGAVAQYNTSSGGTCASVATFATSQKTTDQELRITYEWRFS